ncbi:Developmentally regulated GTP-binding protein 1 [Spironucleus salmonicida]|uniref:Developmentally regulated GTP-binding protein 1 n=1 Tax=Spironucleus salmonicida TaxID=348837 RepID=V6LHB3_9EUKA|nr:Developmentally regulated GTP-binding protein 1 [Spironucleus salmonicida]|eukprot:EST43955.1 Developmentally regulated GTP-binding protein 1 [Spironucleus salmonicida]
MSDTMRRIQDIEDEINRTQKNKATEFHVGRLKARLAQLRNDLIQQTTKKSGSGGVGFDVQKTGHARVGLVGFPSVGKSSLLVKLTAAKSEVAAYEFTTLTAIPGTIFYKDTKIQMVDLPGIIEGAKDNRGKGRQVIATARTSDLLLIILDATKSLEMKRKIEYELEGFGIRLNKRVPDIRVERRDKGGVALQTNCELKYLNDALVASILAEYKIFNADVYVNLPDSTVDELIDVVEGNRAYLPALYVVNKIDSITIQELDLFDSLPNWVPISCKQSWNLDELLEKIWQKLGIIRVYTRPRGGQADLEEPVILRTRRQIPTVEQFVLNIHKDLLAKMKYAVVWGRSTKHMGQHVGKAHVLSDEDVVSIVTQ